MKMIALALAASALLLALAAPADAALARRAPVVAKSEAAANPLALFEETRETLARLLFAEFAERLSTIERLFDAPEAPAPVDLEKAADFLRRG